MEKLGRNTPTGLSANALRAWGMLFLAAGIISRGILQSRLLGLGGLTAQQLLEVMANSQSMAVATAALVLQALETCAIPIFAFLLVEGFVHTGDWKKYLLRVAGVAVLCELPYNLAMSGSLLDTASRNPAIGLVIAMVLLYFYQRFEERSLQNTLIKVCVLIAAVLWAEMLSIDHGTPLMLMVTTLWTLRKKPQLRSLVGAVVAMACSIVSPFYLVSAMAFLPVHLYNGEQGSDNRVINYFAYPAILLVIGLAALFAF